MNGKLRKLVRTNMVLYILLLLVFAGLTARLSPLLAAGEVAAALLVWYVSRRRNKVMQQQLHQYVERISGGADTAKTSNMLFAPMPMMVFNPDSEDVLWANDLFAELPGVGESIYESRVRDVVKGFETHWLMEGKPEYPGVFTWNDRRYRVFGCLSQPEEKGRFGVLATTYWMDVTDLEHMRSTLEETKPVAAIVMIDNYEDLMSACPEGKRSAIRAAIEEKMDQWRGTSGALLMKYDRDRYLMVFTEKQYEAFAQGRFAILDEVRTVQAAEGVYATMSIGVGREAGSYDALLKNAGLALEMALSRGGDQAVVKDRMNFEFYGGRAKTTEKRTKVKSRVMANALGDLMDETEHVYVMGHQYADMDTLGAAAGVCAIARKRGKVARIVMDTENNSVGPMLRKLKALPEYKDVFIGGGDAFLRVQPDTLLVVVDTNRPASVESEPLLEACNRVAVIDHHRRGSSYIEKMALNFHEPYASSASELVAELGYLLEPGDLLKTEAEALLAGIVLDTKNFTNRTGGRTFEAAAYLRRAGADTQDVQRMFQSDLESMIDRYAIIRQAVLYREDLAIAAIDEECERVTAAKAADELLTLSGVQASFVFYPKDGGVYISARSLGEVNVQVIVEALGGGGNSTSAGGQLPGVTVEQVRQMLQEAIDKYYEKSNQGGTAK